MFLIAVCAVCKLDVKEVYYAKLTWWQTDIRTVLGDFNAASSCDRAGLEIAVVPHGSGADANDEPCRTMGYLQAGNTQHISPLANVQETLEATDACGMAF